VETDKTMIAAGISMSGMRRKDKEITDKVVIEEIFRESQVGRLGTAVDSEPYIVPMNFVYYDDRIFLHTYKDGKKVQNIKKNPRVCFEVDNGGELITGELPCDYSWEYRSAIAYGEARILEDPQERLLALRLLSDKYAFGKGKLITPELLAMYSHLLLIEIKIDKMTGKKSPA